MSGAIPTDCLYDTAAIRALELAATDRHGIPALTLMQRAGSAVWRETQARWPRLEDLTVVCGAGNNGGDGYVVARLAREAGCRVRVLQLGDTARLGPDARRCLDDLEQQGCRPEAWADQRLADAGVLVDALFGIGLTRAIDEPYAAAVRRLNGSGRPVVSVDVPSGVDATTGAVRGPAVHAQLTVSFIGMKQGLVTGAAPDYTGTLCLATLELPAAAYASVAPTARRLRLDALSNRLPVRRRTAHKGHFGHVLVVGGAPGFSGAVRMAGEAALRAGAGLVSIATHPGHAAQIAAVRPEIMSHGVARPEDLRPLLERATVIAVGPGLGTGDWGAALLGRVLDARHPAPRILDADALNLLAVEPAARADWVLTPHPGEAARLLATTTQAVGADRFAAARTLQSRYGGVVVLKGAGTLVLGCDDPLPGVCTAGNPGMASGGMGDVLTGVIAGLAAQGLNASEAARLGVAVHAAAADAAARAGQRGLIATDLLDYLRSALNPPAPAGGDAPGDPVRG